MTSLSSRVGLAVLGLFLAAPHVSAQVFLYQNNFNGGDGGLTVLNEAGTPFEGPWTYSATAGIGGTGGWFANGQNTNNGVANTTHLTTPVLNVPGTGPVTLFFSHRHSFEDAGGNWDGGIVQVSINGSAFTQLPGASFTANGYNGSVQTMPYTGNSILLGLPAYVSVSDGYTTPSFLNSAANLGTLNAGDTLQVRFTGGFDSNTFGANLPGWELDNLTIMGVPEPASLALAGLGFAGAAWWRRKRG
jgi:hypothetical protein